MGDCPAAFAGPWGLTFELIGAQRRLGLSEGLEGLVEKREELEALPRNTADTDC
jgi:hypothetical protein